MSKELDLGSWVNDVVQHLLENYSGAFDSLGGVVSGFSEGIDTHRMIDDQVDRYERVNARWITAHRGHGIAHRS